MLTPDFSNFPVLETERLLMRKMTMQDGPQIFELRSSTDVMRYIDKERAATLADAELYIRRIQQSLNANDGITWAMAFKNEPEKLIGTIGYWRLVKEHYRAEIGYMLHPLYWRQGVMKEAIEKVVDTGFKWLRLHSIEANINPENTASENILLQAGFVKEAYFKENYFFNGHFKDTVIYSRLQTPSGK